MRSSVKSKLQDEENEKAMDQMEKDVSEFDSVN